MVHQRFYSCLSTYTHTRDGKCDPFVIINALKWQTRTFKLSVDTRLFAASATVCTIYTKYEMVRPTKTRSLLYPSYLFILYSLHGVYAMRTNAHK